jgi:hypothetical protein
MELNLHLDEIKRMFNTNNIWVNLAAIRDRLDQMKMEILANEKAIILFFIKKYLKCLNSYNKLINLIFNR